MKTKAITTAVKAQGTLTMDTQPLDGDTYTVDTKVYTFQTLLTDVDGNVNIGGSLAQAKLNLVAAFDLSGTPGTDYANLMTAHASVDIAAFAADNSVLTAKATGAAGNTLVTTETFDAGTNIFDAATLGTTTAGVTAGGANSEVGSLGGWSIRAIAAAELRIRKSVITGEIIHEVKLATDATDVIAFGNARIDMVGGTYIELISGVIVGSLWYD